MRRHLFLLSLLLLAAPLFGQRGRPGSQAGSDLVIRISSQTDRQVSEEHLRVQLLNAGGVPMSETFSAFDGTATFHDVGSGNYKIRISGNSIDTVTTDLFNIQTGEGEHTEYVHVAVKTPAAAAEAAPAPHQQPIVSLSALNAPPAAKSELDKGNDAFAKEDLKTASIRFQKAIEIYPQ